MYEKTISSEVVAELIIKKSKFISFIYFVKNEEEIMNYLNTIKKEHKSANHICYAYILNGGKEKCSDDGEPSGTAGLPILTYLKQNNLVNVLCVVVRYFGGVKLGAGGLIRAYKNSAKSALEQAKIIPFKVYKTYELIVPYEKVASFTEEKEDKLYNITNIQYEEQVIIKIEVEEQNQKLFETQLKAYLKKE